MRLSALVVVLALVTTACGVPSGDVAGPDDLSTTSTSTTVHFEDPPPSIEACGLSDPWDMVETAFVGTVSEVESRVNEQRQFELEERGLEASAAEWPWVTFVVDRWFTNDYGTRFSMWAPGFDGAPGQEWQIAGALYSVDEQSGEVFPCISVPVTESEMTAWGERFGGTVAAGSGTPEGEPDPELLARIQDHREIWEVNRPDDYTVIISAYDDRQWVDACGEADLVRLVVEDGELIEAVDLRRMCRVEDTSDVYTIEDLFDLATKAAAAVEGEVTFDEDYGFITGFYASDRSIEVSIYVPFMSDVAAPAHLVTESVSEAVAEARSRWDQAGIDSYQMTVGVQCFCPSGSYDVTVVDGEVQEVRAQEGAEEVDPDLASPIFTIDGLFDEIETWLGENPESLIVGFSELGYPVDAHLDPQLNTFDDELTIFIRGFTPLP